MAEGDDQDPEQKTEDPSQRRLEDARKRGQLVTSREVSSFFLLLLLAAMVAVILPSMMVKTKGILFPFIDRPDLMLADASGLGQVLTHLLGQVALVILVPLVAAMAVAYGASFLQHGNIFTTDPLMPKLDRISPMAGWKRLFSMRSVVEMLKGIIKISIVTWAIWFAIKTELSHLKSLPDDDIVAMLIFLGKITYKVMLAVCIIMFFVAAMDYGYQRHEFMKNMRMTKQEIRDEYKQQEGDPKIKQRLRQIRMERARNRMMAEVPKSDVVITNPTHYAIALKYDNKSMAAPKVVAKGVDYVAKTIRELAEKNGVMIVQNPPLARALYDSVDLDAEIPAKHYKAVADVISYVYKLKGKIPKRT
jgi:flagellar biosynthesis protein FlhB